MVRGSFCTPPPGASLESVTVPTSGRRSIFRSSFGQAGLFPATDPPSHATPAAKAGCRDSRFSFSSLRIFQAEHGPCTTASLSRALAELLSLIASGAAVRVAVPV